MPEYKLIPLNRLMEPPLPVRFSMDDEKMQELIDSIRVNGILQNLVVVPAGDLYEIIAGHRRYKAACAVKLVDAPCLIFQDKEIARHAAMLDENLCREDITAAEEAQMYAELCEKYDYTEEQLLSAVKRPAAYVYQRLALLKGHPAVLDAVRERKITLSVATQLNRVDDAGHCAYLTRMAVEGGATARTVMEWVKDYKANGPSPVVDLKPFEEAGKAGQAEADKVRCFLCRSSAYPGNMVWVPIHDFERDALIEQTNQAAQLPAEEVETAPQGSE